MKIKQYRDHFISEITPNFDVLEAESIFYLILESYRKLRRVDLALDPALEFNSDEIGKWDQAVSLLKQNIPVQYILGKASFYGLEFDVNPNVLIPRPETEELVDWIYHSNAFSANKKILDIGTGSGCIAITLASKLSGSDVAAIDVSPEALLIAKNNAKKNNVQVRFIQMDILKAETLSENFDIIVSNPPYVRILEKSEIKKNVLDHEPHLALFVADEDPLLFYRKIADLALTNLEIGGQLFFEINQYLGSDMLALLQNNGFSEIEIRKDSYGNDRMIKAIR